MNLTDRQQKVLAFIRDYVDVWQIAPSVQEIARWVGVCRATVDQDIARLVAAGRLRREPGCPRSLWVVTRQQASPPARIAV